MPWPLIRIDLDEQARDFQKTALQPGFPVLDRFGANSHILRQWLGRFAADATWDGQTVRFLWNNEGDSSPPSSVQIARLFDLKGPLRSEVEALQAKIKQIVPKTPNDRVLCGVVQRQLDRALSGENDVPGTFLKVRIRGRHSLVWCSGYDRRHAKSVPMVICPQASCRLAFFDDDQTRHRCPRCNTKVPSSSISRTLALFVMLLFVIGAGGFFAWDLAGRPGIVKSVVIEGSVVDATSGEWIPAATIHDVNDLQTQVESNAEGRFRLKILQRGSEQLEVAAPGFNPLTWDVPQSTPATGPHMIKLVGASDVTGLVVEAGTDHPVPFPKIRVITAGRRGSGDELGLFSLPGVPSGKTEIEVSAEGFQPLRTEVELKPGRSPDLLLALTGAATARGSVQDIVNREPIHNATIKVLDRSGESVTDARGEFERGELPGGDCRFEVSAPCYLSREFVRSVTDGPPLRFLLRPELTSLDGIVVDSSGEPIPQATVQIEGRAAVKTSSDGKFTQPDLRQQTHQAKVTANGYPTRTVEVTPGNTPSRIVLGGSAKLMGRVVDAAKKTPVKGAVIRLADGRWRATSDGEGRFEITELPTGSISIEAFGTGYKTTRQESLLEPGDIHLEVELRGATVLSGVVKSLLDGQPISGTVVRMEGLDQPQVTNDDGVFRFEDVVVGASKLNVTAVGFHPETVTSETRTDQEMVVPIVLKGAARLAGQVVDAATKQPIEKAEVAIDGTDRKLVTNRNGEFVQEGFPGRPVRLTVAAKGYSPDKVEYDLRRTENSDKASILQSVPALVIPLGRPHAIQVTVVDARSDKPVAGATVILASTSESAVTDVNGQFQFAAPTAESYEFGVAAKGYPTQSFIQRAERIDDTTKRATFKLPLQLEHDEKPDVSVKPSVPPSREPLPPAERLRDKEKKRPLDVEFFGIRNTAATVGYVVDCSGSMQGSRIERTKLELLKSVLNLNPEQTFYAAFFSENAIPMWGGESAPVPASPLNKVRTYNWIKTIQVQSGTEPQGALKLVAGMNPQSIYLLTDGEFEPLDESLFDEFQRKKIRVNALAIEDEAGKNLLEEIAKRTQGAYRFIPASPIPEFTESLLVTRLFDELLELWFDPKATSKDAREAHEALIEFCNGEDFGPRSNASEADRRRAHTAWLLWWVENKLVPSIASKDEAFLVKKLEDSSLYWRWAALETLGQYGSRDPSRIIPLVRDDESGIHQAARRFLTKLALDEDFGPPEDADVATRRDAFDKWNEWWRRERHILSLEKTPDDSLIHEFNSSDIRTRLAAVQVAADRKKPFAFPDRLIEKLTDSDARVREAAHRALVKTAGKDLGPRGADLASCQAAVASWTKWSTEKSDKQAEQILRLGEALEAKQLSDKAKEFYFKVIEKHPSTESARKAEARLKALGL